MPGYTHLQRAQPVLLAHHLLAYVEMLDRDRERLPTAAAAPTCCRSAPARSPGTTFPIDREYVARALGSRAVTDNSIDAVSRPRLRRSSSCRRVHPA